MKRPGAILGPEIPWWLGSLLVTLRGLVNEAEADLALEGVAATALRALGRLGGPDAGAVQRMHLPQGLAWST